MLRIDRYLLKLLVVAFCFFVLIFGGVIWLTQTVKLIDTVISSGQSIRVFLLFSVYVLPTVMGFTLPLAAFAATLYVLNKLFTEAELVVMMMSWHSHGALARPVILFALTAFMLSFVTIVFLVPKGSGQLNVGSAAIRSEIANALIVEGQFLYPAPGVTLFIRDTSSSGQMAGIFLHDQRNALRPVTYSAERALLLRSGDEARLVMSRGVALNYDAEFNTMSQVRFDELVYDLSEFVTSSGATERWPETYSLPELFSPTPAMLESKKYQYGNYIASGHEKVVTSLNAFALPLLALALMLSGGYQRSGFAPRILSAVAIGIVVVAGGIGAKSIVIGDPSQWLLIYAPVTLSLVTSALLLIRASSSSGSRGRQAA